MIGPAAEPPHGEPYRWRWQVLALVLAAEAMDILDTTTVNVIGPSVQRSLGGATGLVQWIAAAYTLSFAVLLVTGARLGDRYGRRRMFLLGAAAFTAASVACALAPSPVFLVALRALQGASAALLLPQGLGLVYRAFSGDELGKALGFYAPVLSVAAVAGPLLAGGLIAWDAFGLGWRLTFLVNLPVGLVTMAFASRFLPHDVEGVPRALDLRGVLLLGLAMLLVVYPLIDLGSARAIWPALPSLALGLGLLALFVRSERQSPHPLLARVLMQRRTFLRGLLSAVLYFAAAAGIMLVISLYAQHHLGYSALGAGLILAPAALGNVLGALISQYVQRRKGPGLAMQTHLALAMAGLAAVGAIGLRQPAGPFYLPAAALVVGTGLGGVIAPLFAATLAGMAEGEEGSAAGALGAAQQLGAALGVASVASVYAVLAAAVSAWALGVAALACVVLLAGCWGVGRTWPMATR